MNWWLLGIITLIVACGAIVWLYRFQTYHLLTVKEKVLYRTGNRGLRELVTTVRKIKPKTVVTLIDDKELAHPEKPMFQQEHDYLEKQGVRLVRIAIPLGGWPTKQDVQQFLSIVNDPQNQPVIVHCAQGVRRTGMMVAAYQQSVLGYDYARAKAEMQAFGHSQRTVKDIERFIDGYDPQTGDVPTGLPLGKE
jgi:tyrosine-protein phosphatase SIW14